MFWRNSISFEKDTEKFVISSEGLIQIIVRFRAGNILCMFASHTICTLNILLRGKKNLTQWGLCGNHCLIKTSRNLIFNSFVPITPFVYLLKTSENLTVFWYFQELEKGCIGNEWVNLSNKCKLKSYWLL